MKETVLPLRLAEVEALYLRFGLNQNQLARIFRVKPKSIERYFYRIADRKENINNER
jgi:hypothetical protein